MNLVRKHITDLSHIRTRISKKVYGIGNANFVAQKISEWRVDELEDWQRDLIEKIRVGVELKDDDIVKAMGC